MKDDDNILAGLVIGFILATVFWIYIIVLSLTPSRYVEGGKEFIIDHKSYKCTKINTLIKPGNGYENQK